MESLEFTRETSVLRVDEVSRYRCGQNGNEADPYHHDHYSREPP